VIRTGASVGEDGSVVPRRLAAIDVGSNAMRLRIVQLMADGRQIELASVRATVRLGAEVFATKKISRRTLERAAASFVELRDRMDEAGIDAYRAVATSATREASNGRALVRAAADAGIDLEIIDGSEEARLVRASLRRSLVLEGRTVTADIGGGSTEVAVFEDERVIRSRSLPLGTLRLSQETAGARSAAGGVIGSRHLRALTDSVERTLARVSPWISDADRFVATGGTARALGKMCGTIGADEIRIADVMRLTERLRLLSDDERMRAFGLRADRADTIVPGALVIARVAAASGARSVVVPAAGVRDGILAELDLRRGSRAA
jgi:exopolyphosphatase/guanosine-5'-triphosphate,3'-diphosphate pyrophosphatase